MENSGQDKQTTGQSSNSLTSVVSEPQVIESVFDAELEDALPLIEGLLAKLSGQPQQSAQSRTLLLLQSLWKYFRAFDLLRDSNDCANAAGHFEEITSQFDQLGYNYLRDLSTGMFAYCTAIAELRRMNIGTALVWFEKTKKFLELAGKYSSRFEMMISLMESEALFVAGIQALMALDLANAKVLIYQAAQASENAANSYFEKNSPQFFTFMGQAQFQRSFYEVVVAYTDLNKFEYNKLTAANKLAETAEKACELLRKAEPNVAHVKLKLSLSEGFVQLLIAIQELALVMQKIFVSTLKADFKTFRPISEKIMAANHSFTQCGPQAVAMVRFCDQIYSQVNNLERLARPDKKDFGKFSGVIACALFLPIFLVMSWAKNQFHIDFEGYKLVGSCISLSLIGGFGFGALRFKNFLGSFLGGKRK